MADNEAKLLEYLKRVTADLRRAQRRVRDAESTAREPIAIVGMACRLPGGVGSPEDLWDLVTQGRDAVTALPEDRGWDLDAIYHPDPEHPGTAYVRTGGFVHDAGEFDAAFFGIGPAEALGMAPQQRLALETSWEAIERAGIDPLSLRSAPVGVFLGCDGLDYCLSDAEVPEGTAGYFTIGNAASVTSGRVSYTLGLEGPALTIATACSSSLVAIHAACESLRRGESTLALAGAVHVMSSPAALIGFSEMRALAPDGRSKAFSAKADGMTLAEGAGVLLLERLSDARRHGRRVLAVIRGSAVNQDGASNGLTAPNGPAQQRVIRQALVNARLSASDVDAVEAHGTGTTLGDPIEAQALLATYGQDRPGDAPLWLGSVKSNIGHTQMTAGVAGVIKMVLALRHETLPASLHLDEPSTHVDWSAGAVRLLDRARAWPRGDRPRRAGVSSFGFSGTNAHLIVEEAPEPEPEPAPAGRTGPVPWVLSARSAAALRAQAGRLRELAERGASAAEVGWSLITTRPAFEHRAVILGQDPYAALPALARGEAHPDVVTGQPNLGGPGPVLVFPGQGSQWAGMGAQLLRDSPVFAARITECEHALAPYVDWSLTDILRGDGTELTHVDVIQPVLWAIMVSLTAVWTDHGITPAAVIGHSQGEIAAACIAGALTLNDAAKIVALRSKALRQLTGHGAMASLLVGEAEARRLAGAAVDVAVGAVNSPASTVICGPPGQVAAVVAAAQDKGVRARLIDVDYASHGPQIDRITAELTTVLAGIVPTAATVPFYSTVTGGLTDTATLDTAYWIRNLRQPVRFADTVDALLDAGHRVFIEVSPHPVLTPAVEECAERAGTAATTIGTLRRDHDEQAQLTRALAHAYGTGLHVDWTRWFPADPPPRTVDLPTYPFQRQRYWVDRAAPAAAGAGGAPDEAEARLWRAIEDGDIGTLTDLLGLDGQDAVAAVGPALPALSAWRRRHREQSSLASYRYEVAWTSVQVPAPAVPSGPWLLLVPRAHCDGPAVDAAVDALEAHGAEVIRAVLDAAQATRETLTTLLAGTESAAVLSLLGLDETPHPEFEAVPTGLSATLALVQAMTDTNTTTPLWCLTQGAVATTNAEPLPHPTQAQIWGFGRVAALEHPKLWGGLIDLPLDIDHQTAARVAAVLSPGLAEDQIAVRATGVFARRMRHASPATTGEWHPTGTTLITGGTGGIGAHLARWLATNGAPHLLLLSRRGPDAPGVDQLTRELKALGSQVTVIACDVADRPRLEQTLGQIPADRPLSTIFHAAGVLNHLPITKLTTAELDNVLRPKSHAAAHLHELARHHPVTTFLLFSSGAATWGSGQQSAYAAANHYLDALAHHRHHDHRPATSLAWGLWGETGMVADEAATAFLARFGVHPIQPDLAVRGLHQAIAAGTTALTIASIDWARFIPTFTAARTSPLLADLPENSRPAAADKAAAAPLVAELAGATAAQRSQILLRHVQTQAAATLGLPSPAAVPAHTPFQELGFDSLTAVQLRNHLNASTGLQLPTTVVFDRPTPQELAGYLHTRLEGDGAPTEGAILAELAKWAAASASGQVDAAARRRIAVRMRSLASSWSDGPAADGRDLETATADDMFALISEEFGRS